MFLFFSISFFLLFVFLYFSLQDFVVLCFSHVFLMFLFFSISLKRFFLPVWKYRDCDLLVSGAAHCSDIVTS
jgi:hypothetical protein